MEDSVEELRAEFVYLLRKQVEARELDAYVGLTDAERSEYNKRQERIHDLDTKMSGSSDPGALGNGQHSSEPLPPKQVSPENAARANPRHS